MVVLGIRNCAFQALANVESDALPRELKVGERRGNLLAADEAGDEVELLRRHTKHAGDRLGFVVRQSAGCGWLTHGSLPLRLLVRRVTVKGTGRGELAELVAHHLFGHVDRNVLLAVVDAES